jgi:hypothetical protein
MAELLDKFIGTWALVRAVDESGGGVWTVAGN